MFQPYPGLCHPDNSLVTIPNDITVFFYFYKTFNNKIKGTHTCEVELVTLYAVKGSEVMYGIDLQKIFNFC